MLHAITPPMSTDTPIRSRENPLIKRAAAALAGREKGVLALEGERLVEDALGAGHRLDLILVAEDRPDLLRRHAGARPVDTLLLGRISGLDTSPGILALGPEPASVDWSLLKLDASFLLLVVAGIADPRNLGALARSAEAFRVSGLAICGGGVSPWNPKALRGSMGSLLRLPIVRSPDPRTMSSDLRQRGVRQIRAATRGGTDPDAFLWRGPLALWLSGETGELDLDTKDFESLTLRIADSVESLNVTVAGSLLLYCAHKRRHHGG